MRSLSSLRIVRGLACAAFLVPGAHLAACGPAGSASGARGIASGAREAREDRVVIGGYGEIVAMAASQRMVFAASPAGLAIYDRLGQRWLPPLAESDGYPAGRVTALAADPEVDGVWIAALGEVLFYRPGVDHLTRTIVAGRTERIFFDRDDPAAGAYVGSEGQWSRVSHGGFAFRVPQSELPPQQRRIASQSYESIAEEIPALASFSGLLTRDEAMRSWRPTSAAQVRGMSEVWLGTLGGGVYLADPLFNRARRMPFGLFEPGASALAPASDGVWVASLGRDVRGTGGVAFATADLQSWRWLRGPADGSMVGNRTHDMLVRDGRIWLATDRGVAYRELRDGDGGREPEWRWDRVGDRRAYALATLRGKVWVGTDDGLRVAVADSNAGVGVSFENDGGSGGMVGYAVRALASVGDTLWIGSAAGLGMDIVPDSHIGVIRGDTGSGRPGRLLGGSPMPALPAWVRQPVVALARSDSVMVVMTGERAGVMNLRTRAVSTLPGNPDLVRFGALISAAVDAHTIWIGAERGAVVIDRISGLTRSANVPGILPEPVLDIVLQPEFAWLATPTGLVRIRRLPDGGIR